MALFFGGMASFTSGGPDTGIPGGKTVYAEVSVQDEPVASGRWYRTVGNLISVKAAEYKHAGPRYGARSAAGQESARRRNIGTSLQIYADTTLLLNAGDRMVVAETFYPFTAEDGAYGRLMIRRGMAGRMFIYPDGIIAAGSPGRISWPGRLHNAAVRKFSELPGASLHGVVAAMTTGDKRHISRELRQTYTDGGGAHLLAVSGLHVGIVFILVNLLLYFVPAVCRGHVVKNIAAAGAVWLFACAAGLSPSVVRAATMFTFAQAALARGTTRSAINILAASAFLILAMSPHLSGDPGFVLSYAAVLAILLYFGPVFKMVRTGNRVVDGILSVYIVGIAASLAVAPFVSFWFGRVPVAGIIVNPLVIITAHIIVMAGVLWLIWPFGFGGGVYSWVIGAAERSQDAVMVWCAGLEWGAVDVKLPLAAAIMAYVLIILSAVMLGRYSEARTKRLSLPE
ncbi:MAG: ComEC/Rec2 family competence protein [Alistipes sp.]|nr:ComEC/Rec2 family competence protein [Alistipes sp.]